MFFGRDASFVAGRILNQPLASCKMKEKEMIGGCCVCSDEKGYSDNPLVYCDGDNCDVAVHQGLLSLPLRTSKIRIGCAFRRILIALLLEYLAKPALLFLGSVVF